MAALWGEQVGQFERTAPGFQGAVLLREGPGDGRGGAGGAARPDGRLRPRGLLAKPLSCRFRTL